MRRARCYNERRIAFSTILLAVAICALHSSCKKRPNCTVAEMKRVLRVPPDRVQLFSGTRSYSSVQKTLDVLGAPQHEVKNVDRLCVKQHGSKSCYKHMLIIVPNANVYGVCGSLHLVFLENRLFHTRFIPKTKDELKILLKRIHDSGGPIGVSSRPSLKPRAFGKNRSITYTYSIFDRRHSGKVEQVGLSDTRLGSAVDNLIRCEQNYLF